MFRRGWREHFLKMTKRKILSQWFVLFLITSVWKAKKQKRIVFAAASFGWLASRPLSKKDLSWEVTSGRDTAPHGRNEDFSFFFSFSLSVFLFSLLPSPPPPPFLPLHIDDADDVGSDELSFAAAWARAKIGIQTSRLLSPGYFFFPCFVFFFPFSILYFFFWVSGRTVAVPIPLLLHFLHTPSGSSRNNICNMPFDQRARTPASSVEIFNEW